MEENSEKRQENGKHCRSYSNYQRKQRNSELFPPAYGTLLRPVLSIFARFSCLYGVVLWSVVLYHFLERIVDMLEVLKPRKHKFRMRGVTISENVGNPVWEAPGVPF